MSCLSLLLIAAVASAQTCIDGDGTTTFTMHMPYHNKNVTVPPVNFPLSSSSYASDNALVAVPSACYERYQSHLGFAPNLDDRQPGGPQGMFFFRVSDAASEYSLLTNMTSCSCGLVVLMHGTSGLRWQSVSYMAALSGMGFVVVALDSQAMPADMGLKGADTLKATDAIATSNYCGVLESYEGRCGTWAKPFCYSSKVANILHEPDVYREFVERNYHIRKRELDYFVEQRGAALIRAFDKIFLFGRSEGAMVSARYYHATLHAKLSGLLLSGYSCEYSYFVSCADHAKLCGGQCSSSLPVLSFIGATDAYFAASGSVAADVAAAPNGYGSPATGNCRAPLDAQGFTRSVSVVFSGTGHSIMYKNDNALRSVISDFLADPTSAAEQPDWASVNRDDCSYAGGVYTCEEIQDEDPCVGYKPNAAAPWQNVGAVGCPSSPAPSPPAAAATSDLPDVSKLGIGGLVGCLVGALVLGWLVGMCMARGKGVKTTTTKVVNHA